MEANKLKEIKQQVFDILHQEISSPEELRIKYLEERIVQESTAASRVIKQLMLQQVDMAEAVCANIDLMMQGDYAPLMETRKALADYLVRAVKAGL